MEIKRLTVDESFSGERIDKILSEKFSLSRSRIKTLCNDGLVKINGTCVKANKILKSGEEVDFVIPDDRTYDITPKDIPIEIIYEDSDLAVINKPQGMTVHAGNGTDGDTLVNALLFRIKDLSGINGVLRPGIVHRIDKNTSGLLVVAKNDFSHLSLAKQIEDKTCRRIYVALLEGVVKDDSGHIETYIGRNPKDRTKMAVLSHGRNAVTDYKVIERCDGYTLCEFSLKTGRTHQIRVHAKYIGHPIVRDPEYGYKNQKFNLKGQLLHAKKLEFVHPRTNEPMSFEAEIPDYFNNVLKKLKKLNDVIGD